MTQGGRPLFDIILPTWSRPHTIEFAIGSVLRQTVADFCLHVVGDGCDAATEKRVRSIGDPRISFRRFPKAPGFGYVHRNVVLRGSDAPNIAYICDDDLWFPDHLERGLGALTNGGFALVAFRSCHVQFPDLLDPHFFAYDWRLPGAQLMRNWFMGAVGCVHRRKVFDTVGYWDDALFRFGDREFYNRVRTSGLPTRYDPTPTVLRFYAQHWDHHYGELAEPPQRRYLESMSDAAWRTRLREATLPGSRPLGVRMRQCGDFTRFAIRSGPKFARFWWQRLARPRRAKEEVPDAPRS